MYDRQDRDWPATTHAEGRSDRRQDSQMPPYPLPSRFSDWSSLGSPCTRTSSHSSPDVRTEQQENIQDLTNVPSAVETNKKEIELVHRKGLLLLLK